MGSTDQEGLVAAFLAAVGVSQSADPSHVDATATLLRKGLERGRDTWPGVIVSEATFGRYVGTLVGAEARDPTEALSSLHLSDLYLACACLNRAPGAVEAFDAAFLTGIDRALRAQHEAEMVDEVRQILRERLLLDDGSGLARLATYSGRGRLASWVSVAAQRTALDLAQSRGSKFATLCTDEFEQAIEVFPEQELAYIRSRYQPELREAFRQAVAGLSERDRLILRLNLVDGVSLRDIAVAYRVNQSTVSRWLAAAREQLRHSIEQTLADQLGLTPGELASLVALMISDFDVTLTELLV